MTPAEGHEMKLNVLLLSIAISLLAMSAGNPVRGDDRPTRLRMIREGMGPVTVVTLMGQPTSVTRKSDSQFTFFYRQLHHNWAINFDDNRVDSIEDAND